MAGFWWNNNAREKKTEAIFKQAVKDHYEDCKKFYDAAYKEMNYTLGYDFIETDEYKKILKESQEKVNDIAKQKSENNLNWTPEELKMFREQRNTTMNEIFDKPVFEFIDNKSARKYKIYATGKVDFEENNMYPSHDNQIGVVINRIPQYAHWLGKVNITMTREEAVKKCYGINHPNAFVQALEALGLLKFDQPKPADKPADEPKSLVKWQDQYGIICKFDKGFDPNQHTHMKWRKLDDGIDDFDAVKVGSQLKIKLPNTYNIAEKPVTATEIRARYKAECVKEAVKDCMCNYGEEQDFIEGLERRGYRIVPID